MTTGFEPSSDTLALYAMQLLDPEEQATVDALLQSSAAARDELARITGDLAAFALTAEMHSPPALARQRLLKQIARERKTLPPRAAPRPSPVQEPAFAPAPPPASANAAEPPPLSIFASYAEQASNFAARAESYVGQVPRDLPAPPPRRVIRRESEVDLRGYGFSAILPFLGWAVAVGVACAAFFFYNQRTELQNTLRTMGAEMNRMEYDSSQARSVVDNLTAHAAQHITLSAESAVSVAPSAKATYVPEKGSLTFIATSLDPLQPYKTYELWLIPADGRDPIPAGTFKPDEHGYANVLIPELPQGIVAKSFGVTIEDDGGAQTPTLPMVLSGGA